jgi:hypothetical protein
MKKLAILFIVFISLISINSCGVYSFSGANINPQIKSFSVSYFNNDSGNGPPVVSDLFTNAIKEKMLNNTNLRFENFDGDAHFEGKISGYNYTIQAPSGGLSSDLRRITITVQVSFINKIEPDEGFENQRFTRFAEFPVDENLEAIEERLITEINLQLVDDIFNRAFVKW